MTTSDEVELSGVFWAWEIIEEVVVHDLHATIQRQFAGDKQTEGTIGVEICGCLHTHNFVHPPRCQEGGDIGWEWGAENGQNHE